MTKTKWLSLLTLTLTSVWSRDPYPINKAIDVLHYKFAFVLSDSSDVIRGNTAITVQFASAVSEFEIDLVSKKPNGKGMTVRQVGPANVVQAFEHMANDRLKITLKKPVFAGNTIVFEVLYDGIPEDGLIISNNKFGDRVFFGDNWPDRGHHWLACVDHPSDKASVEFEVRAPEKFQVVATGVQIEESSTTGRYKLTRWLERTPVPVKVMTMGVARFATEVSQIVNGIPVTTWVYPQERVNGFSDFKVAPEILAFFDRFIGPYPYSKLAHVQSKTRWGGLENAGNIFYFEDVVNGKNEREGLIAHETAHQWFGDSVTEADWHHVWLSEGFATYLTHVYFEHKYGEPHRQADMAADRIKILKSTVNTQHSIVDTTIVQLGDLLSVNTYQKAAWVLHMLRQKVGDEAFWAGMRNYYRKYQNKNALTLDFQREMEASSGKPLDAFFKSWLYQKGTPIITAKWQYDARKQTVLITLKQQQNALFDGDLTLALYEEGNAEPKIQKVPLSQKTIEIKVVLAKKPTKLVLDPQVHLLFDGKLEN